MSEAEILFDVKDGLGVMTLNRPKVLNSLSHGIILEMERVMPEWEKDPSIKAVVLRGAGDRAFSAGGDVAGLYREMRMRRHYEKPSERRAREKAEALRRYRKLMRKRAERDEV